VKSTLFTKEIVISESLSNRGTNQIYWKIEGWKCNAGTSRRNVVLSVHHQTTLTVIGSKTADDWRLWYNVEYNGKTGWIARDFVNQ